MSTTALVLSNNRMLINLDSEFQVKDLYFPYIGQYNQLNKYQNKMFLRIDDEYVSITEENCELQINYADQACIGESVIYFKRSAVELRISEFILADRDIYLKEIQVINNDLTSHQVTIYFQNNFAINESGFADTAVWYQPAGCLLHYKKDIYLAVGSRQKLNQFSCAAKSDRDGLGAYPNDQGKLDLNPVATGDVNSCLSFTCELAPGKHEHFDYFIGATRNLKDITPLVKFIRDSSPVTLRQATASYWHDRMKAVIDSKVIILSKLSQAGSPEFATKVYQQYYLSVMLMLTQIDAHGAVIAANDGQFLKVGGTDSYSYFWPRDAANVAMALCEAGLSEDAQKVLAYSLELTNDQGYFLHKYFPGSRKDDLMLGSSWHPWIDFRGQEILPIQEDATALMILAVAKYYETFADKSFLTKHWKSIEAMLKLLKEYTLERNAPVNPIEKFVIGFSKPLDDTGFKKSKLPSPSFDIWEQYWGVFTYTSFIILAALEKGVAFAEMFSARYFKEDLIVYAKELSKLIQSELYLEDKGRYLKGIRLDTDAKNVMRDASQDAAIIFAYDLADNASKWKHSLSETVANTINDLSLNSRIGGISRKSDDHYLRVNPGESGNPWNITVLWAAQYYLQSQNMSKALQLIDWVMAHADKTGLMAEQIDPNTGFGMGMKPLTWSHAEFVKTIALLVR